MPMLGARRGAGASLPACRTARTGMAQPPDDRIPIRYRVIVRNRVRVGRGRFSGKRLVFAGNRRTMHPQTRAGSAGVSVPVHTGPPRDTAVGAEPGATGNSGAGPIQVFPRPVFACRHGHSPVARRRRVPPDILAFVHVRRRFREKVQQVGRPASGERTTPVAGLYFFTCQRFHAASTAFGYSGRPRLPL